MVSVVDEVFKRDIDREDSLDIMLGDGYGDLIDLIEESVKGSIFDNEREVLEDAGL